MYENYAALHPIDVDSIDSSKEETFSTGPWFSYVPGGHVYWSGFFPYLVPTWYTNWRDETLSWHLTCSFHASLNPSPTAIIRGPEAKKFLSEAFVNNIDKFPVGVIKHGIICLENGLVATHGVLLRTAEDTYEAYWHSPYMEYLFGLKKYDAEIEDISNKRYLFQLQGPRCLEILERVTGEDLHDIEYRHFRESSINGHKVRILRFGMSGGLAYEVHGDIEYAKDDFRKILEVGNPYGIRPIGMVAYLMNHTEGGFPQVGSNFLSATGLDEAFVAQSRKNAEAEGINYDKQQQGMEFFGSVGSDFQNHVFNPFELGLGHCINWNHEFHGKEALLKLKETETHDTVTLVWNAEDLGKIYMSQFQPGVEEYDQIDYPAVGAHALMGHFSSSIDWVYDEEDQQIGRSYGRTYSYYNRSMLSLASIEEKNRKLGSTVYVLWGRPGTPQVKIRATVVPFPYNQHLANDGFDVETIPHLNR